MKKTFLFFSCLLHICASLQSMNTHNNLACIPPEVIINYMFPDNKNVDYEFITLVNIHRACENTQIEEYNTILNTYIMPLVNLSMTNKKLRTDQLVKEIEKRNNTQHVSINSISKYKKYSIFKDEPYWYYLEMFYQPLFYNICSLTKQNEVFNGYHQVFDINYKLQLLVKDYKLYVYLIKDVAKNFVFKDKSLFEYLYNFCEEINENFKDKRTSFLCETLKKECLNKKTLSIKIVQLFLRNLYNKYTIDDSSEENKTYLQRASEFLKLGQVCAPINLYFAFKFTNIERNNLESRTKISHILHDNFKKDNTVDNDLVISNDIFFSQDNTIDNDLFFSYIQKTFNDDPEKTKKIVSACKRLVLKHSNEIQNRISESTCEVDYFVNFQIQNQGSISMSNESIIPLDMLNNE